MTDVPHFAFPFQFNGGSFAEIEQDSMEDLAACVEVAILTQQGWRKEIPTFGVNDPTFEIQPLDLDKLTEEIVAHEPRAAFLFEQHPDKLNQLIADVTLKLSGQEEITGD
jgi:hypothetical protein